MKPRRPNKKKIIILGSGPNRIGQGIEFDYCCCHAAFALRDDGFETIMINCNPETVSTDYDTSDRLYFEPLTFEDVLGTVCEHEASGGAPVGVIVQFGGQTPLNLSQPLKNCGSENHRHLTPESIDLGGRPQAASTSCLQDLQIPQARGRDGGLGRRSRSRVRGNRSLPGSWSGRPMCLADEQW